MRIGELGAGFSILGAASIAAWLSRGSAPGCPPGSPSLGLFGDSLAVGLTPPLSARAAACGMPFLAAAVEGTGAFYWRSHLEPAIAPIGHVPHFDVLLVSLGGNDYHANPASLAEAVKDVAFQAKLYSRRLVWVQPFALPLEDQAGAEALWKHNPNVDAWFPGRALEVDRASASTDPLRHPTPRGYQQFAGALWTWLLRARLFPAR